jgi:hypothetical protein
MKILKKILSVLWGVIGVIAGLFITLATCLFILVLFAVLTFSHILVMFIILIGGVICIKEGIETIYKNSRKI